MSLENRNTQWARAFLDELARGGVRDVILAPGSRSAPLVLAAAMDGRFRMHPILDERSAGFFALGLGKGTGCPAAVITTSGTAGANLYPAVIEASQGEVPLLVLTADRPHRLRDTDGNQAVDQLRLFGPFPRAFFEMAPPSVEGPALRHLRTQAARAVALAAGPPPGPVHLNFPFEEPLEPGMAPGGPGIYAGPAEGHSRVAAGRAEGRPFVRVSRPVLDPPAREEERLQGLLAEARRGIIVAGVVPDPGEVGPAALALGAATGFPVLADPLSGARFSPAHGAQVVGGYDLFLRSPGARESLAPDLVLRVGASPTSSALLEYLAEAGEARQVVVDAGHRWKDHLASAHEYVRASPAPLLDRLAREAPRRGDPHWRDLWETAEAKTRLILQGLPPGELLEGEILAAVVRGLPEGANLLVASSMPVRDLDAFGLPRQELLNVFGNRGASGIDGLVSTTLGIASGRSTGAGAPPTVGVLGDLAFLHDVNGLLATEAQEPGAVFVVVNNDGGGIFHTLPVRDYEPHFTPFFATPHGLEFEKIAELHGLPHFSAGSLEEFEEAFGRALALAGPAMVEVRTRREETHARRRRVMEEVVEAMSQLDVSRE